MLIIVREQKNLRVEIQWEKIFDEKFFAIDVHWRNWRKFSLGEIFVVYGILNYRRLFHVTIILQSIHFNVLHKYFAVEIFVGICYRICTCVQI